MGEQRDKLYETEIVIDKTNSTCLKTPKFLPPKKRPSLQRSRRMTVVPILTQMTPFQSLRIPVQELKLKVPIHWHQLLVQMETWSQRPNKAVVKRRPEKSCPSLDSNKSLEFPASPFVRAKISCL